jgi:UTP--glucose-1-phosphate uridylyltransferase
MLLKKERTFTVKKIRKAVIPAAGLGTRFLPATKTVPKEMLPLVDRPILLHIIEECISAGIEDIVLVAGRGKTAIEDFFDHTYELEDQLEKKGKTDLLEKARHIRDKVNIISIRQKQALGLGHAVYTSRPIVGDEPFAVLLGDEIMLGRPSTTETLVDHYNKTGHSCVAIMEVPQQDVVKYGIIDGQKESDGLYKISNVIEKPAVDKAPTCWALPGRYTFTAEIYDHLANTKPGVGGEIQLTDGMVELAKKERLYGATFTAKRHDAGDKLGYLIANIELGLEHPEVGQGLRNYIKELGSKL